MTIFAGELAAIAFLFGILVGMLMSDWNDSLPVGQMVSHKDVLHIESPVYKSRATIRGQVVLYFVERAPNAFHRFWFRVLLGWEWENL